jgi:hypothetical protein
VQVAELKLRHHPLKNNSNVCLGTRARPDQSLLDVVRMIHVELDVSAIVSALPASRLPSTTNILVELVVVLLISGLA